jgi:hypothetical protein
MSYGILTGDDVYRAYLQDRNLKKISGGGSVGYSAPVMGAVKVTPAEAISRGKGPVSLSGTGLAAASGIPTAAQLAPSAAGSQAGAALPAGLSGSAGSQGAGAGNTPAKTLAAASASPYSAPVAGVYKTLDIAGNVRKILDNKQKYDRMAAANPDFYSSDEANTLRSETDLLRQQGGVPSDLFGAGVDLATAQKNYFALLNSPEYQNDLAAQRYENDYNRFMDKLSELAGKPVERRAVRGFEDASKDARVMAAPEFDARRKSVLENADKSAVARGMFGQVPEEVRRQVLDYENESLRLSAENELANQLIARDEALADSEYGVAVDNRNRELMAAKNDIDKIMARYDFQRGLNNENIARRDERDAASMQEWASTAGGYSDNYMAEIERLQASDDPQKDRKISYLGALRQEKIAGLAAQEGEANSERIKNQIEAAKQLGYVTGEELAGVWGVPVGTPTTEVMKMQLENERWVAEQERRAYEFGEEMNYRYYNTDIDNQYKYNALSQDDWQFSMNYDQKERQNAESNALGWARVDASGNDSEKKTLTAAQSKSYIDNFMKKYITGYDFDDKTFEMIPIYKGDYKQDLARYINSSGFNEADTELLFSQAGFTPKEVEMYLPMKPG